LNALNTEILLRIQESGLAIPSQTTLDGKFAIRVAVTNHRSRREELRSFGKKPSSKTGTALYSSGVGGADDLAFDRIAERPHGVIPELDIRSLAELAQNIVPDC